MISQVKSAWPARDGNSAPCAQCVISASCPLTPQRRGDADALTEEPVPRLFPRGAVLQRQDQLAEWLMFVKTGLLVVRQRDATGRETPVAVIGAGDLLGQSSAVGQTSLFTAEAITPVGVCAVSARGPRGAAPAVTPLSQATVLEHARRALRTLTDWGLVARVPRLEQRIALALCLLAALQPGRTLQLPSQGTLAELLCATRESINRTLRALETRGALRRLPAARVEIDLPALQRLAAAAS